MNFNNKKILVISPQKWSDMHISKHHYSIELVNKKNEVYFLQPASKELSKFFIQEIKERLYVINHSEPKFNVLKFHLRKIYLFAIKFYIRSILKKINVKFDVVINFDNTGTYPNLSIFNAEKRILFLVDQVNRDHVKNYKGFDEPVLSVSDVILNSFDDNIEKKLLNHGLSTQWKQIAEQKVEEYKRSEIIKVGYIGNLTMGKALDKKNISIVIEENPIIEFHFWGNIESEKDTETINWIRFLKNKSNVYLHGVLSPEILSKSITNIDAWIICYDYEYEINKCSNSHKILEYLSTGKVIISSKISSYANNLNLFPMLNTFNNLKFHKLFLETISSLQKLNSIELQMKRKQFALRHTYKKNIEIIESLFSNF